MEANGCADVIAKAGYVQHIDFMLFPSTPAHVLATWQPWLLILLLLLVTV
jgi:hypothetical protein